MQQKKLGVDIVLDILNQTLKANPTSTFIASLLFQYQERGGLSKKQLEGLYHKASKVENINEAKLATLQAIILKKPMKHKSPLPVAAAVFVKDMVAGKLIEDILQKHPQHKRVVFINIKYNNNEPLSLLEIDELKRFHKLLFK